MFATHNPNKPHSPTKTPFAPLLVQRLPQRNKSQKYGRDIKWLSVFGALGHAKVLDILSVFFFSNTLSGDGWTDSFLRRRVYVRTLGWACESVGV